MGADPRRSPIHESIVYTVDGMAADVIAGSLHAVADRQTERERELAASSSRRSRRGEKQHETCVHVRSSFATAAAVASRDI